MKIKNLLTTFTAIVVLAGIASAQIGGPGGITTTPITFSKRSFETSMATALNGKVMGYQYVLIKKGQIVSEKASGMAQNAADGNIPMTLDTPTNMGSLAKFMSGTAMIGLMQKPASIFQYDNGLDLQAKLERPFWTVMPDVWVQNNKAGVENIKIRQLLQHRSGFDTDKVGNRTVLGYLQDDNGFLPAQYDDREYANINFVLNGYLLALYSSPLMKTVLNNNANVFNYTEAQADAEAKQTAGTAMHNLMKTRIWDKMTPAISPNCDAANTLANVAAYGYDSKDDIGAGQITSSINTQGHCGGHGGYYLSARGMANYLAHFNASNLIVDQQGRDAMFTNNMDPDDQLVWSFTNADAWYGDKFGMPNIAWSNGVAGGWRSIIVRLPQDYYLVLFTNSPDISAGGLFNIGKAAFRAGMEHNF